MNINDYQKWTRKTFIYPPDKALEYLTLGLVGEAGEVRLCDELNCDISFILQDNIRKLESRIKRGTTSGSGDKR